MNLDGRLARLEQTIRPGHVPTDSLFIVAGDPSVVREGTALIVAVPPDRLDDPDDAHASALAELTPADRARAAGAKVYINMDPRDL